MLAKDRDRDAMSELWEQVYKLIHKLMGKYFPFCKRCGLEPEDLTQSGYFALVRAVDAYDPEKGYAFNTYLELHVSNAAREALGFRDGRRTPPPHVSSLDEPLPGVEDGSLTLGDTITDESAEAAMEQVQDEWQRALLRECLEGCLSGCPVDQAEVIRARFFEGKTLQAIADQREVPRERIRQLEAKGMRQFRKWSNLKKLQPYLEAADCHGYGLQSFRDHGYVSRVEILAGTW
jgi:RNA polymerase sporulation-specific sigma factor